MHAYVFEENLSPYTALLKGLEAYDNFDFLAEPRSILRKYREKCVVIYQGYKYQLVHFCLALNINWSKVDILTIFCHPTRLWDFHKYVALHAY